MQDVSGSAAPVVAPGEEAPDQERRPDVVSTHVLVPEDEAEKLRALSRKTRVAQSEYLREAVDDLLVKYDRLQEKEGNS